MTVIAASVAEGLMAADSLCLDNDQESWFPTRKIVRVRDMLVGCAGDAADGPPLVEWLRKKRGEAPPVSDGTTLLILAPGKLMTWTRHEGFFVIERGWHAIGSGGAHAQVAMLAGCGVKQAARLVVQVVSTCGGPVVTRRLRGT